MAVLEQFKALREQIKNTGTKISRPVDWVKFILVILMIQIVSIRITCIKENGQYMKRIINWIY